MAASVAVAAAGLLAAWLLYRKGPDAAPARLAARLRPLHVLLSGKYFVDEIYDRLVVRPLRWSAQALFRVVDRVLIDTLAVHGSAFGVRLLGRIPRLYGDGSLHRYLAAILVGIAALLWLS
jgi:NADH-quinone oxidoreductase subunit L